jgi:hypothetical protein
MPTPLGLDYQLLLIPCNSITSEIFKATNKEGIGI